MRPLWVMLALAKTVVQAESSGELPYLLTLVCCDERHSDPVLTGAASSSDPVDVGLMVRGRIEVDDV